LNSFSGAVVVAGHICLDIIPALETGAVLEPGRFVNVGPATVTTGGAVANTGLALHRLGTPVRLVAKVGADRFGVAILDLLRAHEPALVDDMIVDPTTATSYTLVIEPPDVPRLFIHWEGHNATFTATDVDATVFAGAALLHFGYPSIMRSFYADGGVEAATLLRRARVAGLLTSLDVVRPDSDSEAGLVDWDAWCARVFPHVDIFIPNLDEALFFFDRSRAEADSTHADEGLLHTLAGRILDLGVAVVAIKLGAAGLYLRTTPDPARLPSLGVAWVGRELRVPAFRVPVVGTTGAGDCTIAGFLAGLLRGLPPEQVMLSAAAVGAFNVESARNAEDIPPWEIVQARIAAGWDQISLEIAFPDWRRGIAGIWYKTDGAIEFQA
jgi:sugar/nucleoside kinase (ribokinase family)